VALAALLLALTGCSPVRVQDDPAGVACEPDERFLLADAVGKRLGQEVDAHLNVVITLAARSSQENFGGVDASGFGVGISGINPVIRERTTPVFPSLCWDAQYPVALLFRVTLFVDSNERLQAGDTIYCELEDGSPAGLGQQVDQQQATVEVVDLIPGSEPLQVDCKEFYVPPGWTGPLPERY
jgi:hypothetical protein